MDFLKDIYGDESLTYDQLCEKVNANDKIKIANIADGQYVNKQEYDGISEQLRQTKEKLADYDPEWKSKLATVQADSKKELNEYKFTTEVSKALTLANVADEISVKANLDMEKIKLGEDGKITGLEEQLTTLKESKPYLFKPDKPPKLNLGGPTSGLKQQNTNSLKAAIEEHYKN